MWSPQAGGGTHCVDPYRAPLADPRSRSNGQCLSHVFGPFSHLPLRTEGVRVTGVSPLAMAGSPALHRAVHCHWSVYFVGVEVVRPVEGPSGRCPPLRLSLALVWNSEAVLSSTVLSRVPRAHVCISQSLDITSSGRLSLVPYTMSGSTLAAPSLLLHGTHCDLVSYLPVSSCSRWRSALRAWRGLCRHSWMIRWEKLVSHSLAWYSFCS